MSTNRTKIEDAMIGTILSGRFRLEQRVGSGGMSTVYRAFDEKLERAVAIKLLQSAISSEDDQLERFRREARAAARLSHPNVVNVIDAGEDDGMPYIVFEYVDGETLKERIRRVGRLPASEAVAYAIEIGRGLSAAHGERLLHRDVKPQNVLINDEGEAKVTDFGIARSLEMDGLTAPGNVLGTTDYVAPEQALGEPVTERSDIYSLGIVLYEMLTGDVPFKADTQVGVAMQHVREPLPDVRDRRPEVSALLAAVLERATAKDAARRYASADALVHELEQVLAIEAARTGELTGEATSVLRALPDETAKVAPLRMRDPRRLVAAAMLVAAVIAAGLAVLFNRAEPGATGSAAPQRSGALTAVRLQTGSVRDYDPYGDDREEHREDAANAIDGIRGTDWRTENYRSGLQKRGVGLYVRTRAPVAASRLSLITETPGFEAEVYAADSIPSGIEGWRKVAERTTVAESDRIRIDTSGRRYRYYLLWVVDLGAESSASVLELTLQQREPAA